MIEATNKKKLGVPFTYLMLTFLIVKSSANTVRVGGSILPRRSARTSAA